MDLVPRGDLLDRLVPANVPATARAVYIARKGQTATSRHPPRASTAGKPGGSVRWISTSPSTFPASGPLSPGVLPDGIDHGHRERGQHASYIARKGIVGCVGFHQLDIPPSASTTATIRADVSTREATKPDEPVIVGGADDRARASEMGSAPRVPRPCPAGRDWIERQYLTLRRTSLRRSTPERRVLFRRMVEAGGIEPPSEGFPPEVTTCLVAV